MKKRLITWSVICMLMLAICPATVQAAWKNTSAGMMYTTSNGYYKGWHTIGGSKYYFSSQGIMSTGWKKIGKYYYYFGDNGKMRKGWQTIDNKRYYFGDNGVRRHGWRTFKSGKKNLKYYFDKNGVMQTGLTKIGT